MNEESRKRKLIRLEEFDERARNWLIELPFVIKCHSFTLGLRMRAIDLFDSSN